MKYLLLFFFGCSCYAQNITNFVAGTIVPKGTNISNVISGGGGGGDTPIITGQNISAGLRNDTTGKLGLRITPNSNMTVTSLGRWVVAGNTQSHTLRLRNSSCVDIATTTVNTSGATAGQYLYGSITPTVLTSGQDYYILSDEVNGGDQWYDQDAITSTVISFPQATFDTGGGCQLGAGGDSFVPVNAKFH